MKKRALRKEFWREIQKSFQRFLSIFLISALGVSFFAGLRSCKSDMLLSADAFYDNTNMMDLRVLSTMGLTEADLEAVRQIAGIEAAEGVYTGEVIVHRKESDLVVRYYPLTKEINTYSVLSGRLPQTAGECAVDQRFILASGCKIGDRLELESGTNTELTKTLKETALTITGIVSTGRYMSTSRGNGTIGNGKIVGYLVLDPQNVLPDYFTEIYATIHGAKEKNSYSKDYEELTEQVKSRLEEIQKEREEARLLEIKQEAYQELADAQAELEEKQQELLKAEKDIKDGEEEIKKAYEEIAAAKEELQTKREEALAALDKQEQQITENASMLEAAAAELEKKAEPVLAARQEYDSYVKQLEDIGQKPDDIRKILESKGIREENIILAEQEIAAAKEELAGQEQILAAAKEELAAGRQKTEDELAKAQAEIESGEQELKEKEAELLEGKEEYYSNLEENQKLLADGFQELEEARAELEAMEAPEWYILDRDTIESFVSFEQDADRMEAIGKVFPAIFFLVAALVSLTTMTRMVDEGRTQIGTLKALGYNRADIAGKYIKYALYATLSGSILGFLAGGKIFPYIIITTYKLMYTSLPKVIMPINWYYAVMATVLAVLCTTFAAFASCTRELKEPPASLMRPVAPKAGKRILLERVGILWRHLNFTQKASLRNMFRYKKRFFMTVAGIGGCMALLLVGYGIKDSICVMSEIQYDELWLLDATISLDTRLGQQEIKLFADAMQQDERITASTLERTAALDVSFHDITKGANLIVVPDKEACEEFFVFRNRNTKKRFSMPEEGVILSEKLANVLGVKTGDTILLKPEEASAYKVKVSAVTENYIYHYIFLTASIYEEIFGNEPEYNECLMKFASADVSAEEAVAADLLAEYEVVASISVTRTLQQTIDDMLQSLNVITYVLIICAGLLAFVVLYNLSNININERKRELATLKVLGFYDGEVSSYIYRENVLLTFLGILAGIGLGKVLHGFVIQTAEIDLMMFGRIIHPESYLYSTLLTILFAVLIGLMMHFKLKKIDMIESLKSIE